MFTIGNFEKVMVTYTELSYNWAVYTPHTIIFDNEEQKSHLLVWVTLEPGGVQL